MISKHSPAFSLVELMISLIAVSCILAALAPIILKKTKGTVATVGSKEEITTDCQNNANFGPDCTLCTRKYCITCPLSECTTTEFVNVKTCDCKACTDKFDSNCLTCDSTQCTKCKSSKYYLNDDNICTDCPSGSYCDGIKIYDTCPGTGYYCDDEGVHKCADKYSLYCKTCTSSACTSCDSYRYLSGGDCLTCGSGCSGCTSSTYCTSCASYRIYDSTNHTCDKECSSAIANCKYCSSSAKCTECQGGYYLNSSYTCSECTKSNCLNCYNYGNSAGAAVGSCETCAAGYYKNGSSCTACSSKYGSNCVACDSNNCKSCALNYHLSDTTTGSSACESDDSKFNCSDSNFMQIGNLCVTRKNMGDSSILTIPSSISIVTAGSDYCYSQSQSCCWNGKTSSSSCNDDNGGYSGCTRTVCNYAAAEKICENFNYAGYSWRLPTQDEMSGWWYMYSVGLGSEGLMLCDTYSGYSSAWCANGYLLCKASYDNICRPYYVWASDPNSTGLAHRSRSIQQGTATNNTYNNTTPLSVRCVADL